MPETNSSAEGGRSGWQGLRFEAAFAVLNLVRTAKGAPPVGLDENSACPADSALGLDVRFRPQAIGAVDDLVALAGTGRVIAFQAKSGLGRVPTGGQLTSTAARALEQAAREIRDADGARVIGLVFGQLSNPMRVVARWLRAEPDALTPPLRHLAAIGAALGEDPEHVDWVAIRPRLRLLEDPGESRRTLLRGRSTRPRFVAGGRPTIRRRWRVFRHRNSGRRARRKWRIRQDGDRVPGHPTPSIGRMGSYYRVPR